MAYAHNLNYVVLNSLDPLWTSVLTILLRVAINHSYIFYRDCHVEVLWFDICVFLHILHATGTLKLSVCIMASQVNSVSS